MLLCVLNASIVQIYRAFDIAGLLGQHKIKREKCSYSSCYLSYYIDLAPMKNFIIEESIVREVRYDVCRSFTIVINRVTAKRKEEGRTREDAEEK